MAARRILITYGWCRTAYVAMRSLWRQGHSVYACGTHAPLMCAWSRFCRGSAVVADPFTAPEAFTKDVAGLVRCWAIDVVLPGHEDGLVLRRYEHLLPKGTRLACPERAEFENAVDKAWITRLAITAGVPVPATCFPAGIEQATADAADLGYPVVVKLRRSNSGKGVAAVGGPDELTALLKGRFARFCTSPERFPILQRRVAGPVVGACFLADSGRLVAVFQEHYLRCKDGEFGTSVYREPLQSPTLLPLVEAMVSALKWTGIGHFDFLLDRQSGQPLLLEMNPRLWGAINLAYINGYDFVAAWVDQLLGAADPRRHFQPRPEPGLRSLWCVGEAIAMVNRLRARQWREMGGALADTVRSLGRLRCDDWVLSDPLPLAAEAWCYWRLFLKSGGATNPEVEGMLL